MPDFERELARAEEVARAAGAEMLRQRDIGMKVEPKGPGDVVTNIDIAVEKFVRDELGSSFPDDVLAGEELGGEEGNARLWWIDPVDGTRNLTRGIPLSSVSIAFLYEGEAVVGCIYDPYRDELFSARRGHGVKLNGQSVRVAEGQPLSESVIAAKPTPDHLRQFNNVARACVDTRRLATAALELAYLAAGRLDAVIEWGLQPWDTAAGVILVTEGGGRFSDEDGSPFDLRSPCMVATNGSIHEDLVRAIAQR